MNDIGFDLVRFSSGGKNQFLKKTIYKCKYKGVLSHIAVSYFTHKQKCNGKPDMRCLHKCIPNKMWNSIRILSWQSNNAHTKRTSKHWNAFNATSKLKIHASHCVQHTQTHIIPKSLIDVSECMLCVCMNI